MSKEEAVVAGKEEIKKEVEDSDDEGEIEQLQYKIVVLGDGAVGKTSLIMRYCEDHFATSYKQTIGVDFFIKHVVLPGDVHVALQIWDIGGQTIGSKMVQNYIYGAQAVLLTYDITNAASFQNLEDWYGLVKKTFATGSGRTTSMSSTASPEKKEIDGPVVALVANKYDMQHLRAVRLDRHNAFAANNNFHSYALSAKTGDGVSQMFYRVAADLAGVVLTKGDVESAAKVVTAEIVNHPQNDPATKAVVIKPKGEKTCVIQ